MVEERRLSDGIGGNRCVAGGAKKSDKEPVRSRAMVEVSAIVVTWVDGSPAGGGVWGGYERGVRVGMMVPSYVG